MDERNSDKALTVEQQDWMRFLTSEGLAEKAGCPKSMFTKMIVKEFADNAADIGNYKYKIDLTDQIVAIKNGGDGISPDDVHKIFSIKRPLRSSKHWRKGERGALGNGIRAALAGCRICDAELNVVSQGKNHSIALQDNGDVRIKTSDHKLTEGTIVVLRFSSSSGFDSSIEGFLKPQFLTQNTKTLSGKPLPSWFKTEDINVLLMSLPEALTVGEFADQFNVTKSALGLDLNNPLADCTAKVLLDDLIANELKTSITGLPKNTYDGKYSKFDGVYHDGEAKIPYTVSAWGWAEEALKNEGYHNISVLMNGTIMLGSLNLDVKSGRIKLYDGRYNNSDNSYKQLNLNRSWRVTLSISSPFIPIISSGKAPDLMGAFRHGIFEVLYKSMRAAQKLPPKPKPSGMTVKAAAYQVMEDAYLKVSDNGKYWANARQLMYAARPQILKMCKGGSFTDAYFTGKVLPAFLHDHPELTEKWRIAYDKRGSLIQPHTRRTVGLGTVEVDAFGRHNSFIYNDPVNDFSYANAAPDKRFGGVLFIEKEGFHQSIMESGILEKYDLALASTKGQPNIAIRALLDNMAENPDFTVFTITDFDISGVSIRDVLTSDNHLRYTYSNNIKPIKICVDWPLAQQLHDEGLSEPINIDDEQKLDKIYTTLIENHGLEHNAAHFLTGRKLRVEVNALTTSQLLNIIDNKLAEHCVKVLPDREHLVGAWREQKVANALKERQKELQAEFSDQQPPYGILDDVRDLLAEEPELSWDEALSKLMHD
ncbi:hypothetical protein N9741_03915 [Octadecabacter sp.]|nr:hypothetical protein [Octadecabacter sp.]